MMYFSLFLGGAAFAAGFYAGLALVSVAAEYLKIGIKRLKLNVERSRHDR